MLVRCFCGRNSLWYFNGLKGLVCFIRMECFGGSFDYVVS